MKTLDFASWNNRCVLAEGYAQSEKIGELLDLGGPTVGVIFDGDGGWQAPLGAWVQVRGTVVQRSDLPVFVPDPNGPIVQGMPVPEGTDLEEARKRWVIEHATVKLLRPIEQVEAELTKQVGQKVELRGIIWSRNGKWWFVHDGVDLDIELAPGLDVQERHGEAVTLAGTLSREQTFLLRVDAIQPHPAWTLGPCPAD